LLRVLLLRLGAMPADPGRGLLLLAFAIYASVEHCQAAKRAAADIEGHSAAAKLS
jgi:hypothetical protein